jgi:DNA polymerase-3 subunit alpha
MSASVTQFQAAEAGQLSLFGTGVTAALPPVALTLPQVHDVGAEQLHWEKELLGLYVTEHPLVRAAETMADAATALIGSIDAAMAGRRVTIAGMVASVRHLTTKKGEAMAFARLEDLESAVEVTVFPDVFAATRAVWSVDHLALVRGRVDIRDERVQIVVEAAEPFDGVTVAERAEGGAGTARSEPVEDRSPPPSAAHRVDVTLPRSLDHTADIALLGEVFRTLERYEGPDRFYIVVPNGGDTVELEFPNSTTRYCVGLVSALERLVGQGRVEARPLAAG